jgi:hypothetical protein
MSQTTITANQTISLTNLTNQTNLALDAAEFFATQAREARERDERSWTERRQLQIKMFGRVVNRNGRYLSPEESKRETALALAETQAAAQTQPVRCGCGYLRTDARCCGGA